MPTIWSDRAWYAVYCIGAVSDLNSVYENCYIKTDVVFHLSGYNGIGSLPSNVMGLYECHVRVTSTACDHSYAIANPASPYMYEPAYGSKPLYTCQQMLWNLENNFCHELGHAVGIYHNTGYGGCMASGFSPSFNGYSSHHVDHMNAMY